MKPNNSEAQQDYFTFFDYANEKVEANNYLTPYEKALILKTVQLRRFASKQEVDEFIRNESINMVEDDNREYPEY